MTTIGPDDVNDDYEKILPPIISFIKEYKKGLLIVTGIISLIAIAEYLITRPPQGTMMYGVCKTYLELYTTYPQTIDIIEKIQYSKSVRIFFSYIDEFGMHKSEMAECGFKTVEGIGVQVQSILLNRDEVSAEKIETFNTTIRSIVETGPSLDAPWPLSSDILNLKRGKI